MGAFHEVGAPFRHKPQHIGQHLVERGILDASAIAEALHRQSSSKLRIGDELIGLGKVRPFDFYRSLAEQTGRPFIDLRLTPPDASLLNAEDRDFYLQEQCLPWQRKNGTMAFVAVDPLRSYGPLRDRLDEPFLLYQTSSLDILWSVQSAFSSHLTNHARSNLLSLDSAASAHRLLSSRHRLIFALILMSLALAFYAFPKGTFLTLNAIAAVAFISLAALRFLSMDITRKLGFRKTRRQSRREDKDLPIYTIMIPLLREATVLPILADALQKLDYPLAKLDIKLILEETDHETIHAAKQLKLPGIFELILVPSSHPTTKPKACNYALPFARGTFLVVYDAEDIPGAGQLREAVDLFERRGAQLACAQAPLTYYNWTENWLTRHFAIEYAAIFDLLLPTLARFGQPFPLGGTSTHFRTSVLREIGAWDPFNVTEDADLGIRLHEAGYKTDVLSTPTLEEANCSLPSWVRQRSRWLKGWMQTYIVRMRQPLRTLQQLGPIRFVVFQVVIGAFVFAALVHPFFYAALLYAILSAPDASDSLGMIFLFFFNASVLCLGFGAAMLAGLAGASARGLHGLGAHILTMPLYWLLISLGAYRALFQLISRPHYWEKTEHGLSAMAPEHLARARLRRKTKPDPRSI